MRPAHLSDITLSELLGALSHALDLTEGQPAGHCVRCSRIGVAIGREIGLGETGIAELYHALLLKDLGCSSNAARNCELYLTDDLSFKGDFKFIDGSLPQALRFVLGHTGLKAGLAERLPRGDADHQGFGDHVGDGRHADRRGLLCGADACARAD